MDFFPTNTLQAVCRCFFIFKWLTLWFGFCHIVFLRICNCNVWPYNWKVEKFWVLDLWHLTLSFMTVLDVLSVLVCWGCPHKTTTLWEPRQRKSISQFGRLRSPRSRCRQSRFLARAVTWLADGGCVYMADGRREEGKEGVSAWAPWSTQVSLFFKIFQLQVTYSIIFISGVRHSD